MKNEMKWKKWNDTCSSFDHWFRRKKKDRMDLLVKSNALRSKSRKKRKEIENEDNIDGLQRKLKVM